VERADPAAAARHVAMPGRLCHVSWEYDIASPAGREAFLAALEPENVAVLVQSNLRLPAAEWRSLLEAFAKAAPGPAPASGTR
jgi:hypothetical protein